MQFVTDTFEGSQAYFDANSSNNRIGAISTVDLIGGGGDPSDPNNLPDSGPTGLTGTGFFRGEVDNSDKQTQDGLELRFNSPAIYGFALIGLQRDDNFNDLGGLDREEIGIVVEGESFLVSDLLGLTDSSDGNEVQNTQPKDVDPNAAVPDPIPFLGFVTMAPVAGFTLVHGDFVAPGGVVGDNEEFFIDDLVLAKVPETGSSLLLFGVSLAGVLWLRKTLS